MESLNPIANGADRAPWDAAPAIDVAVPKGAVSILFDDPESEDEVRRLVEETALSLTAIAEQFAVPRTSLSQAVRARGWRRPDGASEHLKRPASASRASPSKRLARSLDDFDQVAGRLLRVVDRQINLIEQRMRSGRPSVDEKDARTLGALAKALETVHSLGRQRGKDQRTEGPVDRSALKADLARRIAAWAEGAEDSSVRAG